jgi:ribosomal protein L32
VGNLEIQHPAPTEQLFKTRRETKQTADSWELKNVMKQIAEGKGRRKEKVSSYCMTLRKRQDIGT